MLYKKDLDNKIIIDFSSIKKPIDVKTTCPICSSSLDKTCKDSQNEYKNWIHEKRINWMFN